MATWQEQRARQIQPHLSASDEGALWMQYFDDPYGEPLLSVAVADAMTQVDEQLARSVAMIIATVSPKAVLLVVPRGDGHPRPQDQVLWSAVLELLEGGATELLDLLVVGVRSAWSARESAA